MFIYNKLIKMKKKTALYNFYEVIYKFYNEFKFRNI